MGLVILAVVALSSLIVYILLPHPFEDVGEWYHPQVQNASATRQGSTLLISFYFSNEGKKDLTLERFILYGSNSDTGDGVGGNPPQQNVPGLIVSFNGTKMNDAEKR